MSDKTTIIEKPNRGRRPKAEADKHTTRICLRMWEDEYELFARLAVQEQWPVSSDRRE